jgi:hypothetical protein
MWIDIGWHFSDKRSMKKGRPQIDWAKIGLKGTAKIG